MLVFFHGKDASDVLNGKVEKSVIMLRCKCFDYVMWFCPIFGLYVVSRFVSNVSQVRPFQYRKFSLHLH